MNAVSETPAQRAQRLHAALGTSWSPTPEQTHFLVAACALPYEDEEITSFFFDIIRLHYQQRISECASELSDITALDPGSALMVQILCGSAWPTWAIRGAITFWRRWLNIRHRLLQEISGTINWRVALEALRTGKNYEETKAAASPHRRHVM